MKLSTPYLSEKGVNSDLIGLCTFPCWSRELSSSLLSCLVEMRARSNWDVRQVRIGKSDQSLSSLLGCLPSFGLQNRNRIIGGFNRKRVDGAVQSWCGCLLITNLVQMLRSDARKFPVIRVHTTEMGGWVLSSSLSLLDICFTFGPPKVTCYT